ncbi:hypothetical protein [Vibrio sp. 10N.239.312.D08]|uniref:hypothetical protein n=1 Tax=Vibrio sp. 10N.239.312.D08 TaxID=3229978 RepID=UPI00354F7928
MMYESNIDLINQLLAGASLLKWLTFAAFLLHVKVRLKDGISGNQRELKVTTFGTCVGWLGVIAILSMYPRYLLHKEMTLLDILNPFVDLNSVYSASIELPTREELIGNAADSFTLLSDFTEPTMIMFTTFILFYALGFCLSILGDWRKVRNSSRGGNKFDQPNYQINNARMVIMGFSGPLICLIVSMLMNQPILLVISGILYVKSSSTYSNTCLRLLDEHLHQTPFKTGHLEFNGVPMSFILDLSSYGSTHDEITITTPRKYRVLVQRCLSCRTNRGIYGWPRFRYVDGEYLSIGEPVTEEIYQRLSNQSPDSRVSTTISTDVSDEQRISHRLIERPPHLTVPEPRDNSTITLLNDLEGPEDRTTDIDIQSKPSVLEMDAQPKRRMINIED